MIEVVMALEKELQMMTASMMEVVMGSKKELQVTASMMVFVTWMVLERHMKHQ
jgi:hypothetical protein